MSSDPYYSVGIGFWMTHVLCHVFEGYFGTRLPLNVQYLLRSGAAQNISGQ